MCDWCGLGQLTAINATCNREPPLFPRQILRQRRIDDNPRGLVERCSYSQALFWRHIPVRADRG